MTAASDTSRRPCPRPRTACCLSWPRRPDGQLERGSRTGPRAARDSLTDGAPLAYCFVDSALFAELLGRACDGEVVDGRRIDVTGSDGRPGPVGLTLVPIHRQSRRRALRIPLGCGRTWGAPGCCRTFAEIEELRRVDALKDEFLATASHELRSPLTSIVGFAELLTQVAPEQASLIAPIERNAVDMRRLVEGLLDQARLESGKVTIEPAPVRAQAGGARTHRRDEPRARRPPGRDPRPPRDHHGQRGVLAGARQPGRQRHEVRRGKPDHDLRGADRPSTSRSRWPTRGRASRWTTRSTSSTRSSGPPGAAGDRRKAAGSACPSSAATWSCTAVTSNARAVRDTARRSPSGCRTDRRPDHELDPRSSTTWRTSGSCAGWCWRATATRSLEAANAEDALEILDGVAPRRHAARHPAAGHGRLGRAAGPAGRARTCRLIKVIVCSAAAHAGARGAGPSPRARPGSSPSRSR